MRLLAYLFLLLALSASAEERVTVCFNYGCLSRDEAVFSDDQLRTIGALLAEAKDAAGEREAIGQAIGRLLGWAGQQTPIKADRGGNYADDSVYGRMDCIDHSTTTTRLLRMMEKNGFLRFHTVLEPVVRNRFFFLTHFSAQIEEKMLLSPAKESEQAARYAVDSWFFDNGQPAAVIPLARWFAGDDPNVGSK